MSGPEELEWFVAFKLAAGAAISTAMAALKSKTVLSNKLEGVRTISHVCRSSCVLNAVGILDGLGKKWRVIDLCCGGNDYICEDASREIIITF